MNPMIFSPSSGQPVQINLTFGSQSEKHDQICDLQSRMPLKMASLMPNTRLGSSSSSPLQPKARQWALVILLLLSVQISLAADHDPIRDFCRRWGHQTAVIDNKLYIHGGQVNYNPMTQDPANYTNTLLLYEDLSTVASAGMPPLYANATTNSSVTVPSVSGGILWADDVNKRFYLFGGETRGLGAADPTARFRLFSFDALNRWWEVNGVTDGADLESVAYGAGVGVSERGEGYYYGGWLSEQAVRGWSGLTNGLIKYAFDTDSWTNNTGPDHVGRAEGVMVYIPAGDGGMLVYFGGLRDEFGNGTVGWQDMREIYLYDVLSSKWYVQNATGDVPGMRRRFCGGVMWAHDQSSYNIYIYGGLSPPPSTSGYDDVYILTLPTFTWIKLYPNTTNATGAFPHHSLSCNVINNGQMLIMGGSFPLSSDCDAPSQFGTHNLDMGQQNAEKAVWQLFDPNLTTYAVPDAVVNIVGGGPRGGATKLDPNRGFQAVDLNILMTRKASIAVRTPTRAIPSPTSTGTTGAIHGLGTGVIAGIAVGSAAVAILSLIGCCWFIRTRRRHHLTSRNISTSNQGAPFSQQPPEGSTWTPISSPFPPSPQVRQRFELPAENEIPVELQSPEGSYATPSTTNEGYKVDDQGRVWTNGTGSMPVAPGSPLAEMGSPTRTGQVVEEGQWVAGSPHGSHGRVHQTYYHP